ncbi:MAG: NFACT RNA binding domain-containing protein [Spirochaetaceae bacterium]|jgi:predicted ribosome quality control (RQC) complex YloA/Tae2 family protein|nr:NFACT RNA binding domain-containing protein [Spirochaetaceae bacterium]
MSLNWREIDLILEELDLPGSRIQKVVQSAYDVLILELYRGGQSRSLLIALSPGACRLHETRRGTVKSEKPLRFAEFCKSRLVNGHIEEALQLGDNRIVRLGIRRGENRFRLYARLWSNAANLIVTGEDGTVLDAMRRSPRRGEITGGHYAPEVETPGPGGGPWREYLVRELPGPGSFNEKIDAWYAEQGGALSLEKLREQARRTFEGSMGRLEASLERLRAKETEYAAADRLREYGDIIMANIASIGRGDPWLETDNFYTGERVRIKLDGEKAPAAQAEVYYEQYRKAKNGLAEVREEIAAGEGELVELKQTLERLLGETNPLALHKLLRTRGTKPPGAAAGSAADRKRPGLSFRRKDWLIIVGRDAAENDALLRNQVKGRDLWLHVRDYPGSYVFIKQRSGKTVPLDILLDAGNLALFYSKGRGNGEGDLFYTPVKFLRRAKGGPRGLVIPTQEKNLHISLDKDRLRELERCRIEK